MLVVFEDIHWAATERARPDRVPRRAAARDARCVVLSLARPELLDERAVGRPAARAHEHRPRAAQPPTTWRRSPRPRRRRAAGRASSTRLISSTSRRATRSSSRSSLAALADGAGGRAPSGHRDGRDRVAARRAAARRSATVLLVGGGRRAELLARRPSRRSRATDDVDEALDELERRDLSAASTSSRLEGDVEYRFRHALIRDVAYATLPRAERAARHADVAAPHRGAGRGRHRARRVDPRAPLARSGRAARARCRTCSRPPRSPSAGGRRARSSTCTRWRSSLPTTLGTRASIRLRRGIALKTLDADHEAAAELAARPPRARRAGAARRAALRRAGGGLVRAPRGGARSTRSRRSQFAEELGDPDGRAAALGAR